MKVSSFPRVSRLNVLMFLGALGLTAFYLPSAAVAQEACVRTSTGSVVCGTSVPKPGSTPNRVDSDTTIDTQVHGDVTWELKSCSRKLKKVVCTLSLSSSQDTFVRVYTATRIVDAEGNSYQASFVQFGASKVANGGGYYTNASNAMAKSAHYKTIFEFVDVPASVSQIVLLEAPDGANGVIRFRDIPIN